MNNDLISRSELKKAITEATYNFEQIPIRVDKVQKIIDSAPTVEPEKICIATVTFDKEQLQEIVDEAIADYQLEPIRCKDCKHQKKYWHEDKRMKEKGYWVYGCNLIDDPFVGTPVWGGDNQFCSSAERKGE